MNPIQRATNTLHANPYSFKRTIGIPVEQSIRANLAKIEQNTDDLSFQRLFSTDISKFGLLYWWDKMLVALPKAPLDNMATIENLFLGFLQDECATPQRVFASLGYYLLTQSEHYDARFTKEVFDHRFKSGSWTRSNKLILAPKTQKNLHHLIFIRDAIQQMQPLKIEEYQSKL